MSGEIKQQDKKYDEHTQCALAIDAITLLIGHRRGLFIYICMKGERAMRRCNVTLREVKVVASVCVQELLQACNA